MMTPALTPLLGAALELLTELSHENVDTDEGMERTRALAKRHPGVELDLVWDREPAANAIHYDLLLRVSGHGTVSLSFCPERALPWPLRGAHHPRENQIVIVNGNVVTVEETLSSLDFIWNKGNMMTRLVDLALIRDEIARREIELTPEELQAEVDAFRVQRGLESASDTQRWLSRNGTNLAGLESTLSYKASIVKLRDQIAKGRIEEFFHAHPGEFDRARIARFRVSAEREARRLHAAIQAGEFDFLAAAEQQFASAAGTQGDLFRIVTRQHARAGEIFGERPGELLEPFALDDGFELVRVLAHDIATLEQPDTVRAVRERIFSAWLSEQRDAAAIEWFWGESEPVEVDQAFEDEE